MKILLIDAVCPEELRIAILSNKDLVGFSHEQEFKKDAVGNVYFAKVSRVEPSLQAAFIEYEDDCYGFLPFSEITSDNLLIHNKKGRVQRRGSDNVYKKYKIQDVLKKHQSMIVQLTKEGRGNKAASFSTKIALKGFSCTFHPYGSNIHIARSITSGNDKKKLLALASKINKHCERGLTLIPSALKVTSDVVLQDYQQLHAQWMEIERKIGKHNKPQLLKSELNLIKRSIRNTYEEEFDIVILDGKAAYQQTLSWLQTEHKYACIKMILHNTKVPLFTYYGIEEKIGALYGNRVDLPSGGYLVINLTEALISVDVNSGKMTKEVCLEDTAYKVNLEAAFEITRQIKLRSLSGLIIIDFIDMLNYKHSRSLEEAVESACKYFNCKLEISSISSLGLMQISRQRARNNIIESNTTVCCCCDGDGYRISERSMIAKILRNLHHEHPIYDSITIHVNQNLAMLLLNQHRELLKQMEHNLSADISVCIDPVLDQTQFRMDKLLSLSTRATNKELYSWLGIWFEHITCTE